MTLQSGIGHDLGKIKQVCHKCAVRFAPICANSRLFNSDPTYLLAAAALPEVAMTRHRTIRGTTLVLIMVRPRYGDFSPIRCGKEDA
jgi:hypothetical protein